MAYKKMSFLLRACMTFVLFIGLAQACRHDGRPDTLCSMTCPATARPMVRSSSAGSLGSSAQASLVLCASLSPVLSSSAPAVTAMAKMSELSLGAAAVSGGGEGVPDEGLRRDIGELKEQVALMLRLMQQQQLLTAKQEHERSIARPGRFSSGGSGSELGSIPEWKPRPRHSQDSASSGSLRDGEDGSEPGSGSSREPSRPATPAHMRSPGCPPLAVVRPDSPSASLGAGCGGRGVALSSACETALDGGESSDGSVVETSASDSDSVEAGAGDFVTKTPPAPRRRLAECPPATPDGREHANSGVFGLLLGDKITAYHVYQDREVFMFVGNDYNRDDFKLQIICAYNPRLEASCYETAWDRVPKVHARALALNACFQCIAVDLGLLASDPSLQIKSNNGVTAKVKYPHQQFLHTMRGVIDGYELTEDEVKVLLNSRAFNASFETLFHSYKAVYRGKHASLSSKHPHGSERVQRYVYGELSQDGGSLSLAIQTFKERLNCYVASVKESGASNLELLLELFPTRETWVKPPSFGISVSGK